MIKAAASIALAAILAACVTTEPAATGAGKGAASQASAPSSSNVAPTQELADRPRTRAGGPRAPARVDLDPEQLLNTEQATVSSLLGRPGYERHEQDAKVWQYRSGRCVLDVFLYRNEEVWRVAYFEFRSPDVGPVSATDCFEMLVRENAATVES